jgi:hypothetical protein
MRLKTVAQKSGHDDFAKARELIEIRDTDTLRLRAQLGVKPDKLMRVPNLLQRVIIPAVLEVNGLADFHVEINPIRKGGKERGLVTGFKVSWGAKSKEEIMSAFQELNQPKVGRMARLKAMADSKSLTSPGEEGQAT